MTLTLRTPVLADLSALSDLCLRSKGHWGYDAAFLVACRDELTLRPEDLARSRLCVAERDGKLVGMAQVSGDGDEAELDKLFVEPAEIGSGIGRILFDWAVNAARTLGARSMTIAADPDAVPIYLAMGAVEDGEVPSGSIPGRMLPRLRLDLVGAGAP